MCFCRAKLSCNELKTKKKSKLTSCSIGSVAIRLNVRNQTRLPWIIEYYWGIELREVITNNTRDLPFSDSLLIRHSSFIFVWAILIFQINHIRIWKPFSKSKTICVCIYTHKHTHIHTPTYIWGEKEGLEEETSLLLPAVIWYSYCKRVKRNRYFFHRSTTTWTNDAGAICFAPLIINANIL